MLERYIYIYIKRPFFFLEREDFELFFHIWVKKLKNQDRNEIFRQMSLTLTLTLDIPVCPMDVKELKTSWQYQGDLSAFHIGLRPYLEQQL